MYESPINLVVQDIETQMVQQEEQIILEAIRKCDVVVDKDELIKAINYDRNQYSKGYKDGVNDVLDKVRAEITDCLKALDELEESGLNIDLPNETSGRRLTYYQCLEFIDKYNTDMRGEDNE